MQPLRNILNATVVSLPNSANYSAPEVMDGEYRGTDGFIYCKECHSRRSTMGFKREVRCICKCQAEKRDREQNLEKQLAKQKRIEKLVDNSLMGRKYRSVNFDNTEPGEASFNIAFKRCKKYCEVADKVLDMGIGIYLFGNRGVGKTRLTACMANYLMNQNYTTLFTNFTEISKELRDTFGKNNMSEKKIISGVAEVDFLFIDDLGVERVIKDDKDLWLQEKIYEVVNTRYNNQAPIIFTSNYSLQELVEERGLDSRTVDRIMEMTETMKIEGNSCRARVNLSSDKPF